MCGAEGEEVEGEREGGKRGEEKGEILLSRILH